MGREAQRRKKRDGRGEGERKRDSGGNRAAGAERRRGARNATAVAKRRRKRDGGGNRAAAVEGRRGARNATAVAEGRRKLYGGGNRAAAAEGSVGMPPLPLLPLPPPPLPPVPRDRELGWRSLIQSRDFFQKSRLLTLVKTDTSPLHKYYPATNKSKPDHVSVDIVSLATDTKVSK